MTIAAFILGLIGTLTGCLALVIQWFTYRRDSAKIRLEARREQQAGEPFFKWSGWSAAPAPALGRFDVTHHFTNEGAAVTDLEIEAQSDIQPDIIPKDHLGEHGSGKITLSKVGVDRLPDVTFAISYVTRLNKRSAQSFVLPTNGTPRRIEDSRTE